MKARSHCWWRRRLAQGGWLGGLGGILPLALAAPAAGQTPDLTACLAIADVEQRVRCYDAIARSQATPAAAGAPAAGPAPETTHPQPAPAPAAGRSHPHSFGLSAAQREAERRAREGEPDQITVIVVAARQVGAGYWQFDMADGTVWRLAETRRSFRPPRPGSSVVIRRGALGAFFLDFDRQPVLQIRRLSQS